MDLQPKNQNGPRERCFFSSACSVDVLSSKSQCFGPQKLRGGQTQNLVMKTFPSVKGGHEKHGSDAKKWPPHNSRAKAVFF